MNNFDVDVIILSNAKNENLFNMTNNTINSLFNSIHNINLNVIIVENNYNLKNEPFYEEFYYDVKLLLTNEQFGYNKFLQMGYENIKSDAKYVMILNNDVICYDNFLNVLLSKLKTYDSVSPIDPYLLNNIAYPNIDLSNDILGYKTGVTLCGWCIVFNKYILDKIPFDQLFPDRYRFWYSDDYYGYMLQKHKFIHALITSSYLHHLTSKTLETVNSSDYYDFTMGQYEIYKKDLNFK